MILEYMTGRGKIFRNETRGSVEAKIGRNDDRVRPDDAFIKIRRCGSRGLRRIVPHPSQTNGAAPDTPSVEPSSPTIIITYLPFC